MSKEMIRKLSHRDPAERKVAIKTLAREADYNAIKKLAVMVQDDPDPAIRELARKAGVFIRQAHGEIEQEEDENSDGKPKRIEISKKNETRAQILVDAAMSQQMNDEMLKAMKSLKQALTLNPNLRNDNYFTSLAESVTGHEGKAALAKLGDEQAQTKYVEKQNRELRDRANKEHRAEIEKATWGGAAFDLVLIGLIVTIGSVLIMALLLYSAGNYITGLEANWEEVRLSRAAGQMTTNAEGITIYESTTQDGATGNPVKFEERIPDPAFYEMAMDLQSTSFTSILPIALVAGPGTVGLVVVMIFLTHLIGATVLRGQGNVRHVAHAISSVFIGRVVMVMILLGVSTLLIFGMEGGTAVYILLGGLALIGLLTVLKLMNSVGHSYHFSPAQGLIALLPGITVMAVGGFLIYSLFA